MKKTASPHTFAVAPGGAVAVLTIDDAMKVRLIISERGAVVRTLAPIAGHDPRHLVAVSPGRFVYLVEESVPGASGLERVVAVPFSARDGVSSPIEVVRRMNVRVQAATVADGVPLLITFTAGEPESWEVHALSASGSPTALPEGRTLVTFVRFTPDLAVLRGASDTTILAMPNNGGPCRVSVSQRGSTGLPRTTQVVTSLETIGLGAISVGSEGPRCRARWTHPDGSVTLLGQLPPPMQGVEDWRRAGAAWHGERQGVLLTVDPNEFR